MKTSGRITHVRVLNRGRGYDPLRRLQIIPEQETPNVVTSFDINRVWQRHPNSPTTGVFSTSTAGDRLRLRINRIIILNHLTVIELREDLQVLQICR